MSIAIDIINSHSNEKLVRPGKIVVVSVDKVYIQDGNSPTISRIFKKYGFQTLHNSSSTAAFFDHSVLPPNIEISDQLKEAKLFCEKFGIKMFKNGEGISHLVALEEGYFQEGNIVLGSDSHTCTGGVNNCLALGMGATDIVAAMITGNTWLRVPETLQIRVLGDPGKHTRAKDVVLYILSKYKQDPFLYRSLEWIGNWINSSSFDSITTLANMTVEMGGKCSFFPSRTSGSLGDTAHGIDEELSINIDGLPPFICKPHSLFNAFPIHECSGQKIDYVFVGSCTNSKIEDIEEVARFLRGKKISANTSLVVTPGSQKIFLTSLERGYIKDIVEAGGVITPPGCGSCLGTQGPIPASGDRVLSTMNRNFLGRMGNSKAEIFLASPLVAAATAINGEIPRESDLVL